MIAALRDYLLEEGKTLDYVDAEALANRYLRFADDDGEGCDEANPCASSSCKLPPPERNDCTPPRMK